MNPHAKEPERRLKPPRNDSRIHAGSHYHSVGIHSHGKRNKGFLLLEVLVATTLLAVGVTACLRAIFNSLQASRETQMYTQGLFLAQKVMSFAESQVAFKEEWDLPGGWRNFEEAANYQYRVTVDENDDFWTNRIVVTVRWANNPDDVENEDKNFYYRIVTEVPLPRYPEDYRK